MASKTDARIPKPPKPPEKPLMPYMRYSRKVWEQVKNSNPHLKLWEVGKIIGSMWRELPDDEKALYVEEYDAEKSQYAELLRQYQSSPAYQAWLVAKERAEKNAEEQDQERKQSLLRSRERTNDVQQSDLRESYMLEDNEEDPEDQYTVKHVAAGRFQRNHRLMQEILSDSRLPELGQLITQGRMNTLHLQVEQLTNHKRNICSEIESCENRHRAKVVRMQQESERYLADYQKLTATRPMITETQFADMIVRAKQNMVREEEERISRHVAEAEARRKRQQRQQQQQREMDMAVAAEAERRRQLQQQQVRLVHPSGDLGDRPTNVLIQDAKLDPSSQLLCRSNVPGVPTPVCETDISSMPNVSASLPYANGPPPSALPQTATSVGSLKFPPAGHTQHHYPPPMSSAYSSNPIPSHAPSMLRLQSPCGAMTQPNAAYPGLTKNNSDQSKKLSSSASSTSSGSSASSSASSKKRKSESTISKDKKHSNDYPTVDSRGPVPVEVVSEQQPKSAELSVVSGSPSDYPPNTGPSSLMQRQHPPTPQQYMQQQQQRPPTSTLSAAGMLHGVAVPAGHPATFGYDGSGGPVPPGAYYQQHVTGMPQSANHPNYQLRPAYGQHVGYGNMPYPPHPQSVDHPSVIYMQQPHMAPQPTMSQPHIHQPGGPPGMSQPQHPASAAQGVGHPHAGAPMGWHQAGPNYPNQFGPPPPRVYANQGPVGYVQSPIPHGARMPTGYVLPQHGGGTIATSESGVTSAVSGNSSQPIPAPPPYQQQVQPPPSAAAGMHPGYWSGVTQSHHMPAEYASGQQQQQQQHNPPHHYMPTQHLQQQQMEAASGGSAQPSSQMVSMTPTSGAASAATNIDGAPGHMHPDAGQSPVPPHQSNVFYPGYQYSSVSSGGYGTPNVGPPASGYYGVQGEPQLSGAAGGPGGHYPHAGAPQQMPPTAGGWSGHYSQMPRAPHPGYPHGQPPQQPKVSDPSLDHHQAVGAQATSGPLSRPSSVSSNNAMPSS